MTAADLIKLAGGLKYFAYTQEAELTRVAPTPAGPATQRIRINLEKALQGDPEHNLPLNRNDYLFIRPVPDWQVYETVRINGEVKFPGTYTIKKGENITSLIARAGGFTDEAYVRGAVFTRESVKKSQREQMDKMIDRIEMEILAPQPLPSNSTAQDIQAQESDMKRKRELIAKLKSVKPDGRIVISLADAPVKKIYDLQMQHGDTVTIPKNPGIVTVMGAVYNPTSFVYDGRLGYDRYIQMSGGFTPTAERRDVYIIKADGTVVRPGAKHSLEPGDAVVAPEKIEIVSVRREIRDIIDILYKTAITIAVTTTIF
jgi:protein involved in polysaccharide export with SLBB domain